jgi:hypothetical protein
LNEANKPLIGVLHLSSAKVFFFWNNSHETVRSSIDRVEKITRLQPWRVVTRKKEKYTTTHTPTSPNTQAQEKASIGSAAAKHDRPPLDQQRDPVEIAP